MSNMPEFELALIELGKQGREATSQLDLSSARIGLASRIE